MVGVDSRGLSLVQLDRAPMMAEIGKVQASTVQFEAFRQGTRRFQPFR